MLLCLAIEAVRRWRVPWHEVSLQLPFMFGFAPVIVTVQQGALGVCIRKWPLRGSKPSTPFPGRNADGRLEVQDVGVWTSRLIRGGFEENERCWSSTCGFPPKCLLPASCPPAYRFVAAMLSFSSLFLESGCLATLPRAAAARGRDRNAPEGRYCSRSKATTRW